MNLLDPLVSAGLINLVLLALAAGAAALRDRRWAWLAAFLAVSGAVLFSIVVEHRVDGARQMRAVTVEQLAWLGGPLLYCFVRAVSGLRVHPLAHLAAPAALVATQAVLILGYAFEPIPAWLLVAFQLGYTLAAGWLFVMRPAPGGRAALAYWAPLCAISAMAGVHAAQAVRWTAWGRGHPDAVPAMASITVLVSLLALLTLPNAVSRAAARYARSGLAREEARRLFDAAAALIERERLFLRPQLSLGDVAAAMQLAPHRLSQALSDGGGSSFTGLVTRLRVEEAKRLLAEPRNAAVALEPVGMEAGFRSRSVFYAAFKAATGATPGEYRQKLSAPIGPDTPDRDARPAGV